MWLEGGLTYKKCDLHVHSSSCESRSYSYEDFKSAILESDLDVVAITDHNMIDLELINDLVDAMEKAGKKLLAGAELNIYFDGDLVEENRLHLSNKSQYFHGIVWCDVEDAGRLQEAIFTLLDGIGIGPDKRCGLSAKEISKLSEGRAFSFTDIQDQLKSLKYFFTFHENKKDSKRNLSGYLRNGDPYNDRFKNSLFYYNQRLAVEGGKKSKPIADYFEGKLDTTVCCFFCSDAKTIKEIGSRYTWIDFDGTLDSLNLAITDPQSRIATSDTASEMPQQNLTNYLESVRFNMRDESGGWKECELHFAPSYNGVVGSRGSGKSMLARVLSGKIGESYDEFIDRSSIRYRLKGGEYSQNRPECLYLRQGELGDVFDKRSYSSIPFLSSRLDDMKEKACSAAASRFEEIEKLLDEQKESISVFLEKYKSGLKRPDALSRSKPNGYTLKRPPEVQAARDDPESLSDYLTSVKQQLTKQADELKASEFRGDLPESAELTRAVNRRLGVLVSYLDSTIREIDEITNALGHLTAEPFATRDRLVERFFSMLSSSNSNNALELQTYEASISAARSFVEDLLRLNLKIDESDACIRKAVDEMLSPVDPETFVADGDEVSIGLSFEKSVSYEEAVGSQFKRGNQGARAVASLCLGILCNEDPKSYVNANKYRGIAEPLDCVERYYDNVRSEIAKNKDIEIDIAFKGKSMKEMSPGMQAQALLKLLLDDSIVDGRYNYVVFDQPEDNLDTPTISEVLVSRIKKLKKGVQFFVVSHSAPVIINGDSRVVVVAQAEENHITYEEGTINDPAMKSAIAEILDGGERYLKMRLYKYDFQLPEEEE